MLNTLGIDLVQDQLESFVRCMDKDYDGHISKEEFLGAVEKRKPRKSSGEAAWQVILNLVENDVTNFQRSITRLFKALDSDSSGSIDIRSWSLYYYIIINMVFIHMSSFSELESGLLSLGILMSPDQVMFLRNDLDKNKDGRITLVEFTSAIKLHSAFKADSLPTSPVSASTPAAKHHVLTLATDVAVSSESTAALLEAELAESSRALGDALKRIKTLEAALASTKTSADDTAPA
jgi:Ca2+-binding EF-hand superfamily protein